MSKCEYGCHLLTGKVAEHMCPACIERDKLKPHWVNPWENAIPVPIEELAKCAGGIGQRFQDMNGASFIMTPEIQLSHWRQAGEKLDAYILPCRSGWHSIGIRYGAEGSQYLSPMGDRDKVIALLKRYT